jgi:hypothetical protein
LCGDEVVLFLEVEAGKRTGAHADRELPAQRPEAALRG